MISLSQDGAFIADAAIRLKIPTIRGSTGRQDGGGEKGGAGAFRAAVGAIRAGGVMLLTPDGPRGPRETLQAGPVQLAKAAGRPVYLMGLAATPSLAMKSWDGGRLPLPFARAALIVEGPVSGRRVRLRPTRSKRRGASGSRSYERLKAAPKPSWRRDDDLRRSTRLMKSPPASQPRP